MSEICPARPPDARVPAARVAQGRPGDRGILDTVVVGGVRLRQRGGVLAVSQSARRSTRVALDTVIPANGAFVVRLLDAVRTLSATRIVVLHVLGGSNTRQPTGRCGAGTEEALVWLALGRGARPVRAQRVVVASCRTTREVDADTVALSGDSLVVPFWDAGRDSTFIVRYSRRAADRGLSVEPARPGRR